MTQIITTPDKIYTPDGLELDTVLFEPKRGTNRAIINIHGISGHYLQNHFISYMARSYPENGYAFFTVNNRGHDYIADVVKSKINGTDRVQKGSAFDIIEESSFDILPAIDYLNKQGYEEIILQGHSLGVLKACYFLSTEKNHGISKTILLSPMDVIHLLDNQVKDWKYWRDMAETMIEGRRGQQYMGTKIWLDVPISADSFWDYAKEDSNMWQFNFSNLSREFIHFNKIKIPMLVVLPEGDNIAIGIDKEQAKNELKKRTASKSFKAEILPGSGHGYWGHEEKLMEVINNWLK
ncbi:MAG: Alpha/beta hydrolase fold protein [Candidatus Gottesmanbacteria bacterium GW2011_GWC2_39_8]|uniref:Alpha/beta hydrolase fold protein n=1 Tax=Candidatus Gottesmanbacteria bacterium GW2011_GWC2_39_8 TaxID=1618450 RepID=A0A0G0Q9K9_9BACT|nr:MAG: Alpha/beta hydrolase fold protein [Candidatus Gottesmanbacteria bacterium GW2011_GWC2_39_8]